MGLPVWLWPHAMSLEAPAVAVLWALALGAVHGTRWWPGVLPGLALAVWLIYLADRVIDTLGMRGEQLDARHRFCLRARPWIVGLVLPIGAVVLAWLALWVVPTALMWQCVMLGMLVILYLALYAASERPLLYLLLVSFVGMVAMAGVQALPLPPLLNTAGSVLIVVLMALLLLRHARQHFFLLLPKEVACGVIFALGCSAWVRFIGTGHSFFSGAWETVLLSALFTCNLTGISSTRREREPAPTAGSEKPGYSHEGFLAGLVFTSAVAVAGPWLGLSERLQVVGWASAGGAVLLALLHAVRHRLTVDLYRVLADAAVAAPAVALIMVGNRNSL
jgi:hypothetical protein